MGTGYSYECHKCGYKFNQMNGIGFLFPVVYAETVQQAKDGELGTQIQKFFEEHPDGAVNAENVTLCCNSCGTLVTGQDLTMYIPKKDCYSKGENTKWSVGVPLEGSKCFTADELIDYFEEYAKYPHKCKKCNGQMRVLREDEELVCPECKSPLSPTADIIMWD